MMRAQMAAGIHPIKVSWSPRQNAAWNTRPSRSRARKGISTAMTIKSAIHPCRCCQPRCRSTEAAQRVAVHEHLDSESPQSRYGMDYHQAQHSVRGEPELYL